MSFNPFKEKPVAINKLFMNWDQLYPKAYSKNDTDPYTKTRIILMNGTEFENVWFAHQFHRHCNNNDIRRDVAFLRRQEQQQQKLISYLKPVDENILETTIGYEQLAVDLTAQLAMHEKDEYVKAALDFALLEDFDHLYRYADLLDMDCGIHAERLVGKYTELMPGRPTITHHRDPFDEVRRHITASADPYTKLTVNIITAAEQQTMNYYMNVGPTYFNDYGRKLYEEIAMVEEEHVTEYGSLIDPTCSWLENLLMHEYVECYLYYSCMKDETDDCIKKVWEHCLQMEIAHLHYAKDMLERYEKKCWEEVIPGGDFPTLLTFQPNIEYVRNVLANTVYNTAKSEDYCDVNKLPDDYRFFKYQDAICPNVGMDSGHNTIESYIAKFGKDYRFEIKESPIKELRDRTCDNTTIGRVKH